VDGGHARDEVLGLIADRVQLGVTRLAARLEVRELRDRPASEHADTQLPLHGRHGKGSGAASAGPSGTSPHSLDLLPRAAPDQAEGRLNSAVVQPRAGHSTQA